MNGFADRLFVLYEVHNLSSDLKTDISSSASGHQQSFFHDDLRQNLQVKGLQSTFSNATFLVQTARNRTSLCQIVNIHPLQKQVSPSAVPHVPQSTVLRKQGHWPSHVHHCQDTRECSDQSAILGMPLGERVWLEYCCLEQYFAAILPVLVICA